jgi:GT2 family glycosyltransferase
MPAEALREPPSLAVDLPPLGAASEGVGFTVINFNTAVQTLRCVESLVHNDPPPAWVLVLDNASQAADYEHLKRSLAPSPATRLQLFRSNINLGFAAGSNFLIDLLMQTPGCDCIGLLNNDAVALPGLTASLRRALESGGVMVGMSGGRMHRLAQPEVVDTLGITLYSSLMPADRKTTEDPYLGPTGGCCLMTRYFLADVKTQCGYWFDERYFCYCEDTDLVLRANLLGYRPAYVDDLIALHEGQASASRQSNNFIAYHGLRNAIWMQCKLIPRSVFWRCAPQWLLAHAFTMVRQILSGRARLLWTVYRDAFKEFGRVWQERQRFEQRRRADGAALRKVMSPRFYRQGYAAVVWSEWKRRWGKA